MITLEKLLGEKIKKVPKINIKIDKIIIFLKNFLNS